VAADAVAMIKLRRSHLFLEPAKPDDTLTAHGGEIRGDIRITEPEDFDHPELDLLKSFRDARMYLDSWAR
jgi:hypothetical protein